MSTSVRESVIDNNGWGDVVVGAPAWYRKNMNQLIFKKEWVSSKGSEFREICGCTVDLFRAAAKSSFHSCASGAHRWSDFQSETPTAIQSKERGTGSTPIPTKTGASGKSGKSSTNLPDWVGCLDPIRNLGEHLTWSPSLGGDLSPARAGASSPTRRPVMDRGSRAVQRPGPRRARRPRPPSSGPASPRRARRSVGRWGDVGRARASSVGRPRPVLGPGQRRSREESESCLSKIPVSCMGSKRSNIFRVPQFQNVPGDHVSEYC